MQYIDELEPLEMSRRKNMKTENEKARGKTNLRNTSLNYF